MTISKQLFFLAASKNVKAQSTSIISKYTISFAPQLTSGISLYKGRNNIMIIITLFLQKVQNYTISN